MSQTEVKDTKTKKADLEARALADIQDMVAACMQCGTCTASCPNSFAMDYTPRQMWRMIIFGMLDEVLKSKTFWLCSACYTCTLRCPRGLPLTRAMAALKRLAALRGGEQRKKAAFYKEFINNVHKYGRVQETGLMFSYFTTMMDPFLPLSYAPLGLKMLGKGKLHPPSGAHKGKLDAIFDKVKQMEGTT
ncbi:MAG: 4Fe-4S dicluster domain-containing protein [Desulfovibrionaceae bacterium]|nr:4Fe-4S dicluster domain-containing protein [Desulfovibrionaceae bacterium]